MGRETVYEYYSASDGNLARRGQLKKVTVPGGFWREMDYGGAGWLVRREVQVSGGSEVTTYTYDAWGRLRLIDYPRSADVSVGYDGENRRVWVQDGVGRREYTYDAWGRVIRQQGCCGDPGIEVVAVIAEYDAAGRKLYEKELNANNTPIRTIEMTYDPLGRLQTIGDYRGQVVYSYDDATGRLLREGYPNGSCVEYAYYGSNHTVAGGLCVEGGAQAFGWEFAEFWGEWMELAEALDKAQEGAGGQGSEGGLGDGTAFGAVSFHRV